MTYLFLLSRSPYGSTLAREALDMALAAAAFEQNVQLAFIGDGVFQLLAEQQADIKQRKNIAKTLPVLGLYDIDDIYVDQDALQTRGLITEDILPQAKPLNMQQLQQLISQADTVMSL